jgi:hypothetical protein
VLSDAEQERFSRHLLLDQLGGEGQERLLAGGAWIDLPEAAAEVALWCARYLAASGVGRLFLTGPWAAEALPECRRLQPQVAVCAAAPGSAAEAAVRVALAGAPGPDWPCTLPVAGPVAGPAAAAALGALAALEVVKRLASAGTAAPVPLVAP